MSGLAENGGPSGKCIDQDVHRCFDVTEPRDRHPLRVAQEVRTSLFDRLEYLVAISQTQLPGWLVSIVITYTKWPNTEKQDMAKSVYMRCWTAQLHETTASVTMPLVATDRTIRAFQGLEQAKSITSSKCRISKNNLRIV